MTLAKRKHVSIDFSDTSGGLNTSEDPTRIRKNQVQECLNAILRKNGLERRPGTAAKTAFNLTTTIKGLHLYLQDDGTEKLLCGSGGKLYELSKSDGTPTERFNITGSGNFYFADSLDKCWITNDFRLIKLENETAYQVGIDAPTGVSAAAGAGGSLAIGDYEVYVSYARKVGGTNVLYSQGEYLGTVTLTAGNQKIAITSFANSADAQVNNKVVWMTDANGATVYFYYETDDNTTTAFDVLDNTDKNTLIQYNVFAVNNAVPSDFEYVLAFDSRIWGSSGRRLSYSLRNASNPYDLERFFPLNYIDFEYEINGIFSIGPNLYVNTPAGIFAVPNADVSARPIHVEKRWYFFHMKTVKDYNGGKIGLTQDGVKFFDGEKFFDYDISEDVKLEISNIYNNTTDFEPCGAIYRRHIRTEYHLSYIDDNISTSTNNSRLVLNLDKLAFLPEKKVIAPWEIWDNAATDIAVANDGLVMYQAQSHTSTPKVYVENVNNTYDNGIILKDGSIGTATTEVEFIVATRAHLLNMSARERWNLLRTMARVAALVQFEIIIRDVEGTSNTQDIGTGEGRSLWDVFLWDVGTWEGTTPILYKKKLPMNLRGYMVYIRITQTANDPSLNILETKLEGISTVSRFT